MLKNNNVSRSSVIDHRIRTGIMDIQSELNLYEHVNFVAETSKQNGKSNNNKRGNFQNKTTLNVRPKRKKKAKSKQRQNLKPQQQLQLQHQKPKPHQQQGQNHQHNSGAKKKSNKFQSKVSSPIIVINNLFFFQFTDLFFLISIAKSKTKCAKSAEESASASIRTRC